MEKSALTLHHLTFLVSSTMRELRSVLLIEAITTCSSFLHFAMLLVSMIGTCEFIYFLLLISAKSFGISEEIWCGYMWSKRLLWNFRLVKKSFSVFDHLTYKLQTETCLMPFVLFCNAVYPLHLWRINSFTTPTTESEMTHIHHEMLKQFKVKN